MPLPSNLQPRASTRLRICVLGTRGFPNVQGGIETHCENLYPELVKKGCEVILFTRKPYVTPEPTTYSGVTLVPLSCPKSKYFETIIHTIKGVLAAKKLTPDILHIHAIGPSLLVPLARILGMKVVITHHGPDYKRAKWGFFAKTILRIGEWAGITFANEVITIADNIAEDLKKGFGRNNINVIPNGVNVPEPIITDGILQDLSLKKNKYILSVGRFVPEKGFHDLIDAFNRVQGSGWRVEGKSTENQMPVDWKLVIVGDADHEDSYSLDLKEKARRNSSIVLTGLLTGKPLQELYSHAGLFVLPSYYEGLPIALLEAMSYGLSCLVSNIPANRNAELSGERFFEVGDVKSLSEKLEKFIGKTLTEEDKKIQIDGIGEKYNWRRIADRTFEIYV